MSNHMSTRNVNIACGSSFLLDESWVNLDYTPSHPSIRRTNLLGKLPFPDSSVDDVYSLHFVEHIPLSSLPLSLQECHRILKPDGRTRVALPDFEVLCREYLSCRSQDKHDQADSSFLPQAFIFLINMECKSEYL